jgi:hypothetical protein
MITLTALLYENLYTGSSGITVQATANTGYSSLYFGDPDDTKVGGLEYNHNTDGMSVQSGNATTMFLDSSQRVLIGTSSSINGYHVQVAENSGYAGVSVLRYTTDAFGAYLNLGKSRTATIGGDTIVQDNDVVGYITFSPNDGTDLVSISSQIQGEIDGTPGANDMPGRQWISDGTRTDGFLAHEAQAVVPECVTGTKDAVGADGKPEYQGIDQSKLVPLLTAALQEALTKIETLEAKVTALENA